MGADREALDKELAELNRAFERAVAARKEWMNAHMSDYARYQVGEQLYDLDTGRLLGTIARHYRYWGEGYRDPQYDKSMDVEYEFKTPGGTFDNTSRQIGLFYGNAKDLVRRRETDLRIAKMKPDVNGDCFAVVAKNWSKFFPGKDPNA